MTKTGESKPVATCVKEKLVAEREPAALLPARPAAMMAASPTETSSEERRDVARLA